ncbi:hypothetical protein EAS64_33915 [Trebonia kvetii]|uniref:Pectate lyase superfamily protein domain-containing protein n=1 Tax=Trebonia kvetii TaxID=2480626 RepID=A0A6P2BQY3_9ACTN|nr:hypothetical protein [Trebonia kvetii]TVZ01278.1 hypothetical protein EAS64_33915 [Trebonia kvetii]
MTDLALSALAVLTNPQKNVKIAVLDPNDTSTVPAGASGSDKTMPIASMASSVFGVLFPSADSSGATDTAAINAICQAGRTAYLVPGTYYVTNLLPDSNGGIIGSGPDTVLQSVSGTTGAVIACKTPATTVQVTIASLTIIPNTGSSLMGIYLDNTGFSGNPSDVRHTIRDVWVYQASGDAFKFGTNIRGLVMRGGGQYHGQGYGLNVTSGATDNFFTDVISGWSANHGFNLAGGNNMLKGCKAFFAGYNGSTWGTTQCGFELPSTSTYNVLVGCSSQQNALHGYDLQSALHCTLSGNEADSNGAGTTGGAGVNTNAATYCSISGTTGNNNGGLTPAAQQYGIQVAGTQTGTVFNFNPVTGTSGPFNYVSGFGYTYLSQTNSDFSQASFFKTPALVLAADSVQTVTSSYTILTATDGNYAAIPVTASGAVTGVILQAPSNAWTRVTVINQSAFTITFAASGTSHVADGTSNVIPALTARTFVYDGNTSLWYRVA